MNTEFINLLEAGDVAGCMAYYRQHFPNMPAIPEEQAEATFHMARTACLALFFDYRAYSHRWLTERNLPSQLPDELKPKAERLYPVVVEGVGIGILTNGAPITPEQLLVRGKMEEAVQDCYAEGRTDPAFVQQQMQEARQRERRALFGR